MNWLTRDIDYLYKIGRISFYEADLLRDQRVLLFVLQCTTLTIITTIVILYKGF